MRPNQAQDRSASVKSAFTSMKVANAGIFQINETLDNSQVFTSLENAKYLLNYDAETLSAIDIYLKPSVDEDAARTALQSIFENQVIIKNRVQLNERFIKMLNTEHVAVYLIFTLILIIALFNIIGSIIMMILDKKKNLKTLYNLGATVKELRKNFLLPRNFNDDYRWQYRTCYWGDHYLVATTLFACHDYAIACHILWIYN